ncbi:MAG: APH(3') family aminoglycoside O-phosphotransferase [Candidatus Latescibacteria bacterium]|nr:APH(3') family aminoglycoside O-phosphotransferase [Candidatus Latescibacterota bacterium]
MLEGVELPGPIDAALMGYSGDGTNRRTGSEASVFLFTRPGAPSLFLKISSSQRDAALVDERDRMVWLQGKLPVPRVVAYQRQGETEYLLTEQVPGTAAHHWGQQGDKAQLVQVLAQGLQSIHAIDWADCPFDCRKEALLARLRQRLAAGQVEGGAEVLAELEAGQPAVEDLVFTHGDYCLPNILIHRGGLGGFIDWGFAGVGDRYRDLALGSWSVGHNLGEEWIEPFFDACGVEEIDREKIAFYGNGEIG